MSRPPTYARKVDASHATVVKAFEAAGCSVAVIQSSKAGLPDLVIGLAGRTHLVEVKPASTRKDGKESPQSSLRATQTAFAEKWRGSPVHLVHNATEALELANLLRMTAGRALEAESRSKRMDVHRRLALSALGP